METHWRHKNGKVSDILLSSSLLDPAHPYEDVIFIAMDVTELHRSERALKEYSERLKRSNEDLELFAFISSDDLQEPLRTMVTFTQLLEKRYRGQLDPDADEFLHYIVSAGKRMQHLITDLLEFSRVNTQGGDFRPTDATAVVEDVLASIHSIAEENGATITRDRSRVIADANQVRQVFQNLVSNAIKFRRPDVPPPFTSPLNSRMAWSNSR